MNVDQEIHELKRRVGDLEGAMIVPNGQCVQVHSEVTKLKLDASVRFDRLDGTLQRVFSRLDLMNTQVWSLRDDMPVFIASALRLSRQHEE